MASMYWATNGTLITVLTLFFYIFLVFTDLNSMLCSSVEQPILSLFSQNWLINTVTCPEHGSTCNVIRDHARKMNDWSMSQDVGQSTLASPPPPPPPSPSPPPEETRVNLICVGDSLTMVRVQCVCDLVGLVDWQHALAPFEFSGSSSTWRVSQKAIHGPYRSRYNRRYAWKIRHQLRSRHGLRSWRSVLHTPWQKCSWHSLFV